jgi:hypothetical protein
MKNAVLMFLFFLGSHALHGQSLDNGWYNASVSYFNPKTYMRSQYTLQVKVVSDRVVEINFGNGGAVHAGINNSGYMYTGGYLQFWRNFNGQIASASTTVVITQRGSSVSYEIKIE